MAPFGPRRIADLDICHAGHEDDHFLRHRRRRALYASIITGTTIGYGDLTPSTDMGKVLVALPLLVVNVVGAILETTKAYLIQFCMLPEEAAPTTKSAEKTKETPQKLDTKKDK
mmetsp:Transcript_24677/g.40847  ORF Transcript_24677/g.40847 Transcript_24677/m.40847 type:complete len:114 (-) Transcript_24677:132-473(-)